MALATPNAVVLELMTMGQQSAASLAYLLRAASPASPHQELAAEIHRCCDRVIAALRAGGKNKRKVVHHDDDAAAVSTPATMPPGKRCRRAEAPTSVVTSATTTDGFIWRKYGQKEINGRKHPRLYQRCAYRQQGCPATRRVQRTHDDEEPVAYEIAYYGHHTCRGTAASAAPPAVVDSGSNAWPRVAPPASVVSPPGEVSLSQGGWSPSSASSAEARFEAHDTARAGEPSIALAEFLDDPSATAPCRYAPDPVTEFLNGSFDWASVLNDDTFGFGAPGHNVATIR